MKVSEIIAIILFTISVALLVTMINSFNYDFILWLFIIALVLEVIGFLLIRKELFQPKEFDKTSDIEKMSPDETIEFLRKVIEMPNISEGFRKSLKKCLLFLNEIKEANLLISKAILREINGLLTEYIDISNNTIQNKETYEIKNNIEEGFKLIEEALDSVYVKGLNSKKSEIEATINALEMKFKIDGIIE